MSEEWPLFHHSLSVSAAIWLLVLKVERMQMMTEGMRKLRLGGWKTKNKDQQCIFSYIFNIG